VSVPSLSASLLFNHQQMWEVGRDFALGRADV
jgi:hypothetical protein